MPFSFVGADLRTEPLVVAVPEVEKDRYYSIQFVAGHFLPVRPNWKGEAPPDIKQALAFNQWVSPGVQQLWLARQGVPLPVPRCLDGFKPLQPGLNLWDLLSQFHYSRLRLALCLSCRRACSRGEQ